MSTGPINAQIVNIVSPLERASAIALSMFAIHLLGDVPSPPLIGHLSDVGSLAHAVLIVPVAVAIRRRYLARVRKKPTTARRNHTAPEDSGGF